MAAEEAKDAPTATTAPATATAYTPTGTARTVKRRDVAYKQREGGGFVIARVPHLMERSAPGDPFLMLDHFGPITYGPGEAVGAPDHPHRGFETVTVVMEDATGAMQHKDSAGNSGTLSPGAVQWMTAGSGLVHSEMPSEEVQEKGGRVHGFQLWVNLPAKDKWVDPRYQDTPPEDIPKARIPECAGTFRIITGEAYGVKGTIETHTDMLYVDMRLEAGDKTAVAVKSGFNTFVYVYEGKGYVSDDAKAAGLGDVFVLDDGDHLELRAADDSVFKVMVLGGAPIGEPVARHGPFVMNTRDELVQCFDDYHSGLMGAIPGSEERYEATRKAREAQKKSGTWAKDDAEM